MTKQMTILVTGASSGVGHACALLLAQKGYQVLAGVRREIDGTALSKQFPDQIHPIIVDLEDQQTIEIAAGQVKQIVGDDGLQGLVNCAGTIFSGPLEYFPREWWFTQYDVNLFGTMAFTSSMLPLIRKGKGRIVNIGAVGGGISLPFYGAIASAKIAFEAANDCLRRELYPWGIHVVIIEPGGINTPANDKMRASVHRFLETQGPQAKSRYAEPMETFSKWAYQKHIHNLTADQVAKAVLKAIRARFPKTRYRLGWDSHGVALASWILPDRLFDKIILWISSLPLRFGALSDKEDS